jgi:hypothetical protein
MAASASTPQLIQSEPINKPGIELPPIFEFDESATYVPEPGAELVSHLLRNVHLSRRSSLLQPRGDVNGIAPNIVERLVDADHASQDVSAVDAHADVHHASNFFAQSRDQAHDVQSSQYGAIGVIELGMRQARNGQIAIANRFDFFESVSLDDAVKRLEYPVEDGDNVACGFIPGESREADNIDKQHGCDVVIGDYLIIFHTGGN